MELKRTQLLLVMLAMLLLASAWFQPVPEEIDRPESKLAQELQLIFRRISAAQNMSIYVSSRYLQQLPQQQQWLVQRVLGCVLRQSSNRDYLIPVVMDAQLLYELSPHVQLVLFFVQNAIQFEEAAFGSLGPVAKHKHKMLIVLMPPVDGEGIAEAGDKEVRGKVVEETEIRRQKSPSQVEYRERHEVSNEVELEMNQIFQYLLYQRYNIEVLLLLLQMNQPEDATVQGYSYWPYASGRPCGSTTPVAVSLQQARFEQLYPRKVQNLQGCALHVVVWQIPPYVLLHPERKTAEEQLDGYDADLLKLLAKKLNFSLALVENEPPQLIGGASYMNGTLTGAYEMLRQRRGNLTLGCAACMPARSRFLASTLPYTQVEYVMVLTTAGAYYSSYQIMLLPYNGYIWLMLGGLTVLRRVLLAMSIDRIRPLQLALTILLFFLRLCYEGSVFEFVHNAPARPLPQSLEQAIREGYTFITDHATYRMTYTLPALRSRTRIVPGQPVDMFRQLLALPPGSRTAAFSSHAFLAYYLSKHRDQRQSFVMVENKILVNMICMHFPQASYLARVISDLLFDLRSFGICQQLGKRIRWDLLPSTTAARSRPPANSPDNTHFAESMRFIYAAWHCLLVAEAIIFVIFVLELLSQRPRWSWLARYLQRL